MDDDLSTIIPLDRHEGVAVRVVSARLGHKDASVTLNVYAHHIPEDHTKVLDLFSKAVCGT